MKFVLPSEAEELLTPDEIDDWCDLLDEIEQEPMFLHWLEQNNPGILEEFRGIMRNVHALAAQKMWRLADGSPGTARPPQLMPGTPGSASDRTDWRVWLLLAGRGCVAAGTLIETADGRKIPVEDWRGGWVSSRYGDGSVAPALAGPSFLKGRAQLFRVATARGDEIVVTDQHRFLTPTGWARLCEIGVGQLIAAAPAAPSGSHAGGRRSTGTAPGSQC